VDFLAAALIAHFGSGIGRKLGFFASAFPDAFFDAAFSVFFATDSLLVDRVVLAHEGRDPSFVRTGCGLPLRMQPSLRQDNRTPPRYGRKTRLIAVRAWIGRGLPNQDIQKMLSEMSLIESTPEPRTRSTIAADLRALGLRAGSSVLVHSSLRSIGWVAGGPVAVIQALFDVIGDDGTLVMPTHTGGNTDPAEWSWPAVPTHWHATIRESMPVFDPAIFPTRGMGAIPELFRTWPGVIRSGHPTVSFAAWGRHAEYVTANHGLDHSLGETSPLARLFELSADVLLIGVGYDRNTAFHLAEYRVPGKPQIRSGSAIIRDGQRSWETYADIEINAEPFPAIGAALEATGAVRVGSVGSAESRLFSLPAAVDFAQQWMVRARAGHS
jgi:aminoglycoside 3-N-acetyltransferase